jgi:hypothetical protein
VTASAILAALPWLHTRFVVLAAGLGALIVWQLATMGEARRERVKRVLVFLLIPLASAIGWFTFFQVVYGTPNPTAPYGPSPDTRLAYAPGGLLALLLDQQFGLLTFAPALAAALVGLRAWRSRRVSWSIRGVVGVAALYLAASATYWMWWGGVPATPARFAAAALPALAAPVAVGWHRSAAGLQAVWNVLLAVSLTLTGLLLAVDRGALAWNVRGSRAAWLDWMGGIADLPRAWPSFFWRLTPGDVRTELPFAVHAILWLAVFAGVAALVLALRKRTPNASGSERTAAAWWLAAALMLGAAGGWWNSGISGVEAASSQVRLLGTTSRRASALVIAPFSMRSIPDPARRLRIRATRTDAGDTAAEWAPLRDLPAGVYSLTVRERRPRGGVLSVRVGRSAQPVRTMGLEPLSEQTLALRLPAGAAVLTLEPDPVLASVGEAIELTVVSLDPSIRGRAVATATFGGVDVSFLNDAVFIEEDGFWVRGAQTAELVAAFSSRRPALGLELTNGASANLVVVEANGAPVPMTLRASEIRRLEIPLPDGQAVRLRISSPSGFTPSDVGSSRDRRFLGVRVRMP